MENKVAMITGAAVGIGRAVAMLMAQKGAKLVLLDIDLHVQQKLLHHKDLKYLIVLVS